MQWLGPATLTACAAAAGTVLAVTPAPPPVSAPETQVMCSLTRQWQSSRRSATRAEQRPDDGTMRRSWPGCGGWSGLRTVCGSMAQTAQSGRTSKRQPAQRYTSLRAEVARPPSAGGHPAQREGVPRVREGDALLEVARAGLVEVHVAGAAAVPLQAGEPGPAGRCRIRGWSRGRSESAGAGASGRRSALCDQTP